MRPRRHIAALLVAATVAAALPAGAYGQDDGSVPNLTPTPPAEPEPAPAPEPEPTPRRSGPVELPETGTDPRLLVLAGAALLLTGTGLRLRTLDERF